MLIAQPKPILTNHTLFFIFIVLIVIIDIKNNNDDLPTTFYIDKIEI